MFSLCSAHVLVTYLLSHVGWPEPSHGARSNFSDARGKNDLSTRKENGWESCNDNSRFRQHGWKKECSIIYCPTFYLFIPVQGAGAYFLRTQTRTPKTGPFLDKTSPSLRCRRFTWFVFLSQRERKANHIMDRATEARHLLDFKTKTIYCAHSDNRERNTDFPSRPLNGCTVSVPNNWPRVWTVRPGTRRNRKQLTTCLDS